MSDTLPAGTADALDQLQQYALSVPETSQQVNNAVDSAGLGDTDVGKAIKAGAKGAAEGLASGAAVSGTVAGTAVAVGVLATSAAALQVIPVAGTIAGAVIGIVAGLVAFFSGKAKAHAQEIAKLQAEVHDFDVHLSEAVRLLPPEIRDYNTKLWNAAVEQAAREAAINAGNTSEVDIGQYNARNDPWYYQRLLVLLKDIPAKVQASVIDWAKNQPVFFLNLNPPASWPRRHPLLTGAIVLGAGVGIAYAVKERKGKR